MVAPWESDSGCWLYSALLATNLQFLKFSTSSESLPKTKGVYFGMLRSLPVVLLVPAVLTVTIEAQRSGATFQRHDGLHSHSGFLGKRSLSNGLSPQRGIQNGFFPNRFHRHHDRHDGVLLPYFFPEYDPFWYEQAETEGAVEPAQSAVDEQRDDKKLRSRKGSIPKSQIIEIPGAGNSKTAKTQPPTIFILKDGERLESRKFLLTASDLSLKIDDHRRTIPLQMLNGHASIAANRERGIDLRIPDNRNEVFLSF